MKEKLILIIVLCFTALNDSFSQSLSEMFGIPNNTPKIEVDKSSSSGLRFIRGSYYANSRENKADVVRVLDFSYAIGLKQTDDDDKRRWFLYVDINSNETDKAYVLKDAPLLIKTFDDDVVKLSCDDNADPEFLQSVGVNSSYSGLTVTNLKKVDFFVTHTAFEIDESIIEKFKKGIYKIRMEVSSDKAEWVYKKKMRKKELGNFLYTEYLLIKDALNSQKEFDEDF